jgi:hypothetical protein
MRNALPFCTGLPWLPALLLVSGCVPIEVSVSPDGKVLIPRDEGFVAFDPAKGTGQVAWRPGSGQPAFAVFAPDGKRFLAVTKGGEAASVSGMGTGFGVALVGPGGKARNLLGASNITYARWSGDGKFVSLTRVADAAKPPLEENLPELVLVSTADGKRQTVASNVGPIHRWFPDGRHILAFQITAKGEEDGTYAGALVRLDSATGKAAPLATTLGGKKVFIDVSPDGTKALFTAMAATKAGGKAPAKAGDEPHLFELDVASGAVRAVKAGVAFAVYSPKGTKVLVGMPSDDDGDLALAVGDAALTNLRTVATDAAGKTGGMGDSADIYPTWLDDDTVLYLAWHHVYGTAGKNLHLVAVGADGTKRRDLQGTVDAALVE